MRVGMRRDHTAAADARAVQALGAIAIECARGSGRSLSKRKADTRALLRAGGWAVLVELGCRSGGESITLPAQPDGQLVDPGTLLGARRQAGVAAAAPRRGTWPLRSIAAWLANTRTGGTPGSKGA